MLFPRGYGRGRNSGTGHRRGQIFRHYSPLQNFRRGQQLRAPPTAAYRAGQLEGKTKTNEHGPRHMTAQEGHGALYCELSHRNIESALANCEGVVGELDYSCFLTFLFLRQLLFGRQVLALVLDVMHMTKS